MPTFETILTFSVAAFLLSISPGPSNLYIMARSMHQGFSAGFAAASGMAIGSFIYVIASALGLAAIFKHAPLAYLILKIVGAVYLIYLGITYLRAKPQVQDSEMSAPIHSNGKIFQQSILVELTNPKTALFFLAFLPQFVFPESGNITTQFILLGFIYMLIAFFCDLFVAAMSGQFGSLMQKHPKLVNYQDKVSGGLLFGIGGYIAGQELLR